MEAIELERLLAAYFADPAAMTPDEARAVGLIMKRLHKDADEFINELRRTYG
jgi:hypothetical protein